MSRVVLSLAVGCLLLGAAAPSLAAKKLLPTTSLTAEDLARIQGVYFWKIVDVDDVRSVRVVFHHREKVGAPWQSKDVGHTTFRVGAAGPIVIATTRDGHLVVTVGSATQVARLPGEYSPNGHSGAGYETDGKLLFSYRTVAKARRVNTSTMLQYLEIELDRGPVDTKR